LEADVLPLNYTPTESISNDRQYISGFN